MSERGGERSAPRPVARPSVAHYLVARREIRGLGPPYVFSDFGEGVLPVFRSRGAARGFLRSLGLGDGWHVRQFSGGELVSLLCAFSAEVQRVSSDPSPGHRSAGGVPAAPMTRERFIETLIAG